MKLSMAHIAAILSFSLWGLFPIYWKSLSEIPAWDLFAHRLIWSFITLTIVVLTRKKLPEMKAAWRNKKTRYLLMISGLFISSNWLLYIYAINTGRILEASMGYFLNPLINILMGWLILQEKIRPLQWPSVLMAILAILMIALQTDMNHFPWIALTLSLTFAFYGLIRKLVPVGSIEGLYFETGFLVIPVLIYWFFQETNFLTALEVTSVGKFLLLSLSGMVTTIPLILFAYAAKRLPLRTMGFIQYLSPSLKFICGSLIFHEALSQERLYAFVMIWIALAWYTLESFLFLRKKSILT